MFLYLNGDRRGLVWGGPAGCFGVEFKPWAEDSRCPFLSPRGPPCLIWDGGGGGFYGAGLCSTWEKQFIYVGCAAGVSGLVLGAWCCPWDGKGQIWPLREVISGLQKFPVLLLALISSWFLQELWYFLLKHEHQCLNHDLLRCLVSCLLYSSDPHQNVLGYILPSAFPRPVSPLRAHPGLSLTGLLLSGFWSPLPLGQCSMLVGWGRSKKNMAGLPWQSSD